MSSLLIQSIPSILAIIVCVVILIFLIKNYFMNQFLPTIIFIIFFSGMLLWSITKLVSAFLPSTTNVDTIFYLKISSLTILLLSLLTITFFRDLLSYSTLSYPSIIVSFFCGITLAALWWGNFVDVSYNVNSGWNTDYETWFLIILLVYLVTVYIFMFSLLIKGFFQAKIKQQKQQMTFIITGLAIASIGGTLVNFILNIAFPTLGDIDLIFVVLGFGIIAIAYIRNPIQIYFVPVIVRRLIVMNKDGLPLLSHDFCIETKKGLTMDPVLISGALSGIVNLLKETLQSKSIPKIINLDDRVLLLQKSDSALFALIADENSLALRSALKEFSLGFEKMFKKELRNWTGYVDGFNKALDLILEDFSFVLRSNPEIESYV